jgi:CheY-like chemotaxis protein
MESPAMAGLQRRQLVLFADRDDDTREMYGQYLKFAGFETAEARDGREALAKTFSLRPDILVTDTQLSGIDGYELVRLVRHDPDTRTLPILVLTANTFQGELERARKVGADEAIGKPCLPAIVFQHIRELLERSHRLRAEGRTLVARATAEREKSDRLIERAHKVGKVSATRAFSRHETTAPSIPPPHLLCPKCDEPLAYDRSHIGGVSQTNAEQWDYYKCRGGCGAFQYRQRTRKLRQVL